MKKSDDYFINENRTLYYVLLINRKQIKIFLQTNNHSALVLFDYVTIG